MKVGDLVRYKHAGFHELYGLGITVDKYHSSFDYGFVVFFEDKLVHMRQEELEVISEGR